MIDSIRQYIGRCPIFKDNTINVNYLGNKAKVSYSVEAVPSNPVVKKYTDGAKLCQVLFVVASRELYTESPKDNTAVMKFYDLMASEIAPVGSPYTVIVRAEPIEVSLTF